MEGCKEGGKREGELEYIGLITPGRREEGSLKCIHTRCHLEQDINFNHLKVKARVEVSSSY